MTGAQPQIGTAAPASPAGTTNTTDTAPTPGNECGLLGRAIPSYDVAIVGYGPVGVTAANLLGQAGLRVLVAERDPSIYTRARAISTDEEVLRIWQSIGLAERLEQDMLADAPIDFVDDRGRSFIHFTAPGRGNGHPPQLFIYQPALERVLRDGVGRFPNVEVRLGQECVRVRQDADGVDLTLVDSGSDRLLHARARYVIAADGGSSPTRAQLGVTFEGRTYEDRWVVIDTKVIKEWPEHARLRFHCDPARPAVDCPTPLGHHRWEFPVLPGDDEQALVTDEAVWQLLSRQGIGPDNVEILRAVIYSHHVRFAARWRTGRIFLAGDAAHVMPPWIGQGMASGVRDASNLCWKLAGVLSGELPESVLDSYEAERKPHVRLATKKAVFAGRIITERRALIAKARNLVFGTINRIKPLQDALSESQWAPPTSYHTGCLVAGSTRRSAGPVGQLIPQPHVVQPDGSRALLDDATGHGWSVLCVGPVSQADSWRESGAAIFQVLPAGAFREPGVLVDCEQTLVAWFRRHCISAAAIRPDGVVYAVSHQGQLLTGPPLRRRARAAA